MTPPAGQGSVFRFDEAPEIQIPADLDADDVSDHYPVEVRLQLADKQEREAKRNIVKNYLDAIFNDLR